MRESPLFYRWTRKKVEKLAGIFKRKSFPANEYIFKQVSNRFLITRVNLLNYSREQNDEPNYVYFVLEGEVLIQKDVIVLHSNRCLFIT